MKRDEVFAEVGEAAGMAVNPETTVESLGLDSLEILGLLVTLDIPYDALPQLGTVGDIASYVEAHS